MEYDLLHPDPKVEVQKHKLKRQVQKPNSYFLDIKCKCGVIAHTFSNANSTIKCPKCKEILATPGGGKLHLKEGVLFKKKGE